MAQNSYAVYCFPYAAERIDTSVYFIIQNRAYALFFYARLFLTYFSGCPHYNSIKAILI